MDSVGLKKTRRVDPNVGLEVVQSVAVGTVIATAYFGTKPLNAILWVFTFLCLVNVKAAKTHIVDNILFLILCLQYPLVHLIKVVFVDGSVPGAQYTPVAKPQMWMWGGIIALLSMIVFSRIRDLARLVDIAIPPILLLTFLALLYAYLQQDECRIKGSHRNVFAAPLFFTTLTVIYLRNLETKSVAERLMACALIGCSMVVSIVFGGARGVAVAQIVTYSLCCLIFIFTAHSGHKLAQQIVASVVLGALVGFAIDHVRGCNMAVRLSNVSQVIVKPSVSTPTTPNVSTPSSSTPSVSTPSDMTQNKQPDSAVSQRYVYYTKSLELIAGRPLFGYGIAFESLVAKRELLAFEPPHKHVHNIYLSWGLWGGMISVVSGLVFMSANFWSNLGIMRQSSALILVVSVIGPWGVSQIFDSFLVSPHFFYIFIIYLCLCQALLVKET